MNISPLASSTLPTSAASGTPASPDRASASVSTGAAAGTPPSASTDTNAATNKKPDPSRDEVDAAVKKLNDSMLGSSQTLQFSVDHDTKEIVVKLIDQNTKEVVRQMPSEEALRIAKSIDASMDKMQGRLIDHTA